MFRLQGPPGCGKTYTLTKQWIPRAVELHGADSVHVCSLTRAAAAEIGGRANLPRQNITTLHSLAYRARDKPPLAQDAKNVKHWNDRVRAEWRLTGHTRSGTDDLDFKAARAEDGDTLLNEAGVLRAKMISTKEWSGPVLKFYQAWRQWKRDMQFLDFTDLIELPIEFNSPPPSGIKALILDEAQDCTFLDIALLKHWGQWFEMVVMAGDANQALYSFVGANPHAFMPPELPDEEITTLKQSYRVPAAVVEYADRWIQQDTEHRLFPYRPREEGGEPVKGVVARLPGLTVERPTALVRDLLERTADGSSAMVLTTCKYQLNKVIAYLRRSGITYHNPYRVKEGLWNPLRGGAKRMAAFLRPFTPSLDGGDDGWTWADLYAWSSPMKLAGTFRHGAGAEIKFLHKKGGCPTMEEVKMLMVEEAYGELIDAMSESPEKAVEWYADRLNKAGMKLMGFAIAVCQNGTIADLEAEPRIIIGTYHSCKGGEADYAYLCPDLGMAAMKEYDNLSDPEGRNSIIRALYVGITRARKGVALLGASSRNRVEWI